MLCSDPLLCSKSPQSVAPEAATAHCFSGDLELGGAQRAVPAPSVSWGCPDGVSQGGTVSPFASRVPGSQGPRGPLVRPPAGGPTPSRGVSPGRRVFPARQLASLGRAIQRTERKPGLCDPGTPSLLWTASDGHIGRDCARGYTRGGSPNTGLTGAVWLRYLWVPAGSEYRAHGRSLSSQRPGLGWGTDGWICCSPTLQSCTGPPPLPPPGGTYLACHLGCIGPSPREEWNVPCGHWPTRGRHPPPPVCGRRQAGLF